LKSFSLGYVKAGLSEFIDVIFVGATLFTKEQSYCL